MVRLINNSLLGNGRVLQIDSHFGGRSSQVSPGTLLILTEKLRIIEIIEVQERIFSTVNSLLALSPKLLHQLAPILERSLGGMIV